MWCENPDEAFNISCSSLSCEDWCKDNSLCPLQRKDQKMYILVKDAVTLRELEKADVAIQVSEDGKTFKVIKHRSLPNKEEYHMSHLKNVLLTK
jgi:hypothetical protein